MTTKLSGLIRQEYKLQNKFSENCYCLVTGSAIQRFKTWLFQLRTGCTTKCQKRVDFVCLFGKEN